MVMRLALVFLVILLLGGGVGGLTLTGVVPDILGVRPILAELMGVAPEPEPATPAPPPPPDHGPEPVFMRLPQLAVPVIREGASGTYILISMRAHIVPGARPDITRALPRLTDTYLTALVDELPRIQDRTGRLDLASIKAAVNALTVRELGEGKVHDVIIDNAYAR